MSIEAVSDDETRRIIRFASDTLLPISLLTLAHGIA